MSAATQEVSLQTAAHPFVTGDRWITQNIIGSFTTADIGNYRTLFFRKGNGSETTNLNVILAGNEPEFPTRPATQINTLFENLLSTSRIWRAEYGQTTARLLPDPEFEGHVDNPTGNLARRIKEGVAFSVAV